MNVLALDPAFKNVGYCIFSYRDGSFVPVAGRIIRPKRLSAKELKKRKQGKIEHNVNVCRETAAELKSILDCFIPSIVVAERLSGSQDAQAARAMGMSDGILGSVIELEQLPCFWYNNLRIKQHFTGDRHAPKEVMIEEAAKRWPDFAEQNFPKSPKKGKLYAEHTEHLADAIAVMSLAESSEDFKDYLRSIL